MPVTADKYSQRVVDMYDQIRGVYDEPHLSCHGTYGMSHVRRTTVVIIDP